MSEYWLISIPGDKTPAQAFETLNNATYNFISQGKFNLNCNNLH